MQPCSTVCDSGKMAWGKAEALDRLGGDEEFLQELCQIFLKESPKLMEKLREAISVSDGEAVMRAAHSLRGELGYLGAAGALQAAQELEDMGQNNDLFRAYAALAALEGEMTRLYLDLGDPARCIQ
jgi:HPt (histidine-containing phosphotransfer) domain-containing protein